MDVDIVKITCCECYVAFWITTSHQNLLSCKNTFYCPNGHAQAYVGNTDAEKLKKTERLLENVKYDKDRVVRSNSALRGVITKMKNNP